MIRPVNPTKKQYECYQKLGDDVTRFIGFGGGAGGGKSWVGCEWLMVNCYRWPESKWFIGRKELKRLMGSTYLTFLKVCDHHKIPVDDWKLNSKYNYIELYNGSRIDLLDVDYKPSDPMFERLGSLEYTGGFGEEVGEWKFLAFDVLKSRLGRWKNKEFGISVPKFLLTFNPTKNWLYRTFYKPWRDNLLPANHAFIQSLYMDNPYTASEYGKQLNEIKDSIIRARLKDGNWEYEDLDVSLVSYDAIIDLFTNAPAVDEGRYFSADIARYGSDRIIYGCWQGYDLYKIIVKRKQGIDQTITDIRTILQHERIPYSHSIIDEDGVGGGVVDLLRGVKGFVNNSSAIKTKDPIDPTKKELIKQNYSNLKTQCSYMLANKINSHGVSISAKMREPDKESVIEELQQIKRLVTKDVSTLKLMPKEEVKEALGRSPDISDMMIMRMYFELVQPVIYTQPDPSLGHGGVKKY